MIKTILKIDGMMCGMCESHICDVIRKNVPDAKKVTASKSKGEASFLSETEVSAEQLQKAIGETGYICLSVTTEPVKNKLSLFNIKIGK